MNAQHTCIASCWGLRMKVIRTACTLCSFGSRKVNKCSLSFRPHSYATLHVDEAAVTGGLEGGALPRERAGEGLVASSAASAQSRSCTTRHGFSDEGPGYRRKLLLLKTRRKPPAAAGRWSPLVAVDGPAAAPLAMSPDSFNQTCIASCWLCFLRRLLGHAVLSASGRSACGPPR